MIKIAQSTCYDENCEPSLEMFDITAIPEEQKGSIFNDFIGKLRNDKDFKIALERYGFISKSEIPQKTEEIVVADTYYYFNVYSQCSPISVSDVKNGKVSCSTIDDIIRNEKKNGKLMVACQIPEPLKKQIDVRKRQLNKIKTDRENKKREKELEKARKILDSYNQKV